MLRDFVAATIPDNGYKPSSSSSLSSVSLSFLFPFATLFHVPLVKPDFMDRSYNMDTKKSPVKPKERVRRPESTTPSMQTMPSTASSASHTRSISNAIRDVRRLPRKASRIMCIHGLACDGSQIAVDQYLSVVNTRASQDFGSVGLGAGGMGPVKERAAIQAPLVEISASQSSSGTCSISNGSNTNLSSSDLRTSSSAATSVTGSGSVESAPSKRRDTSQNHPILGGPIMAPEELAKALERQSLVDSQQPPMPNHASGRDEGLVAPNSRNFSFPIPEVTTSYHDDEDPIPRPLSPPNFHFRRQRVTSETGSIIEPYTTPSPANSPPGSPRVNRYQPHLHEILSCEDLRSTRMTPFNSDLEPSFYGKRKAWDEKSIKSDIGFSTRPRTLSQRSSMTSTSGASCPTTPKKGGREKTSGYPAVRSHSRLRPSGPLIKEEEDTNELKRVFSH